MHPITIVSIIVLIIGWTWVGALWIIALRKHKAGKGYSEDDDIDWDVNELK